MKILMVGPEPKGKGGMSTVLKNFQLYPEELSDAEMDYLYSWTERHRLLTAITSIMQFLFQTRKKNYQIIHFHVAQDGSFYRKALMCVLAPKKSKIIFHMHSSHFDRFYNERNNFLKKKIRKVLNRVDLIVALSPEWQTFYQTLTSSEVVVVNNAVYLPKDNQYNSESKKILSFGRIGHRKGSYDILEVAQKVYQSDQEIRFILYGDGEIAKFEKMIFDRQLVNIEIGEWLSNPAEVFDDCGLHLLPSYHEGVPMAILETMAYGIPNLSTTVGGIPQVIVDNENGYLVEPGDIDRIHDKILTFFATDKQRVSLSEHARSTIKKDYSFATYFKKWQELYADLVSQ